MNTPTSTALTSSDNSPASPRRGFARELAFLTVTYIGTAVVASLFIGLCGRGCCYIFYSIIAGVSGLLMLRQPLLSRCICLGVLLLSLFGMWHEKETVETWGQRALRLQIEDLQKQLQDVKQK